MTRYTYTTTQVATAGVGIRVKLLSGDGGRISVIISHSATGTFRLFDRNGSGADGLLLDTSGSLTPIILSCRDWGPIIQGDIWFAPEFAAAASVFVVSISKILTNGG